MRSSALGLLFCLAWIFFTSACAVRAQESPDLSRLEVDAAAYPWSPVGRLNAGGRGHCTGFLISERELLTAAHCLHDRVGQRWRSAAELHFLAAYQRGDYRLHSPVESYEVLRDYRPDTTASPAKAVSDWAFVRLERPLGEQTGWCGRRVVIFGSQRGDPECSDRPKTAPKRSSLYRASRAAAGMAHQAPPLSSAGAPKSLRREHGQFTSLPLQPSASPTLRINPAR